MSNFSELKNNSLLGAGADYLENLFEESKSGEAVDKSWQDYFEDPDGNKQTQKTISEVRQRFTNKTGRSNITVEVDDKDNSKQYSIAGIINSYRSRGHEIAKIDPLNIRDYEHIIELSYEGHGLSKADLNTSFNGGSLFNNEKATFYEIFQRLQSIYCGSIGFEYMHIGGTTKKDWLRARIEGNGGELSISPKRRQWLLERLSASEGLEKYLHTQYVGQKRFSLEGGESLIPCLDVLVELSGLNGVEDVVIGMAHRGRLNVLVNIFGKYPSDLFDEFEGKKEHDLLAGDVKYHQGFSSNLRINDHILHLTLAFNPSHLEIVSPVVEGSVRARQDLRGDHDGSRVIPITIHGDASFAGQGVVMETLNMAKSKGYNTHGTIHIVINNQIGFTTSNSFDARSTQYCTDVAKMLNIPIFHVNADDPEAVYSVTKLAFDYRQRFQEDVIIDLVCYRRHGHNEADEPSVTQPNMYKIIRSLSTTREKYSKKLVETNAIKESDIAKIQSSYRNKLKKGLSVAPFVTEEDLIDHHRIDWAPYLTKSQTIDSEIDTTKSLATLQKLGQNISTLPANFLIHSRAENILKQRQEMSMSKRQIDWGFAENLAYATLLDEGHSIRITGQDVRRGTFFHRHATYHNTEERKSYTPLQHIKDRQPKFTIIDSMLSEEAVLAFEYGYSTTRPDSLVIWEAQFGDFANGAQVVIDQFISSGEAKWGRFSGLVMLLPHGYEGQGPEHSSARLERYFQLCAQDNMQLVVPSSPQQIYHLIRRQMLMKVRKPLIVMTPKSLLRLPEAICSLEELANGTFLPVIDAQGVSKVEKVTTLVFCSGKIYYELYKKSQENKLSYIAIIRVEKCYPFPYKELLVIFNKYDKATTFRWCQEEPKNQGAWRSIHHRFDRIMSSIKINEKSKLESFKIEYTGRPSSASPAVGSASVHKSQQELLIDQALGLKGSSKGNPRWRTILTD